MHKFDRFQKFLDGQVSEVYPEPPSNLHTGIARGAIQELFDAKIIAPGDRVLDVGCGSGFALEIFAALGLSPVGVTLGPDYQVCRAKGLDVHEMDQSFIEYPEGYFDFLWCRHVLEHSVFPLFTLSEYHRLTRRGGHVYIEVPAPDTVAHHERNANHYSVLGRSAWVSLFERSGFSIVGWKDMEIPLLIGPDLYWSFLLKK